MDSSSAGGMEICTSTLQYIDFTSPSADYEGSILNDTGSNDFIFRCKLISKGNLKYNKSNCGRNNYT
ncbi:MAG: hypothetical protein ACKPKO_31635 [Candidatus Fonsibacter sp.]